MLFRAKLRSVPIGSLGMDARFLIISPMRNEAAHVERVARAPRRPRPSRPAEWVVVDDGSTDDTAEHPAGARRRGAVPARSIARETEHEPVVDRLTVAAAPARLQLRPARAPSVQDWTHVVKLDGDIELPPDYFERLLEQLRARPRARDGVRQPDRAARRPDGADRRSRAHHVHGALKCYTRACFDDDRRRAEAARLGHDRRDLRAHARLSRPATIDDIVAIHHRPHASADGTLRGRARHGECAYIAHFSLLWVALRSLKIARQPAVRHLGLAFFYGYVRLGRPSCRARAGPRVPSFARWELRGRMRRIARTGG